MASEPTEMLSVYRGQADSGLGAGPGSPILSGEQYLEGTADTLYNRRDSLLSDIRPWLSLDSEPEDHRQAQLEAWSCFCSGGRLFVCRMVLAGKHDNRVAYFSHARSWPQGKVLQADDPGVCLGCPEMFDEPGARPGSSDAALERMRDLPGELWKKHLEKEPQTAVRLLGFLAQSLARQETQAPLLIGVPLSEFSRGSPLFSLVAFARAALPADLKEACSIRMHTRQPENFALRLKARLIVLPADMGTKALRAQRDAILLDRQGKCITDHTLAEQYEDYANEVIKFALAKPKGLLPFSALLGKQKTAKQWANPRWTQAMVRPGYALAVALEGGEEQLKGGFEAVRTGTDADFPWQDLLEDGDWARFPECLLAEFALQPPENLKDVGEVQLQAAVTAALDRLRRSLDGFLTGMGRDTQVLDAEHDRREMNRLIHLLEHNPPLLSRKAVRERFGLRWGEWVLQPPEELDPAGKDLQTRAEHAMLSLDLSLDEALDRCLPMPGLVSGKDGQLRLGRLLDLWDKKLIGDQAMVAKAAPALRELVLASELEADGRGLQAKAEKALQTLGLTLDDALDGWWPETASPNRMDKLKRLLQLLGINGYSKSFGNYAELTRRTQSVALPTWLNTLLTLEGLLKLEVQHGEPGGRRAEEWAKLARQENYHRLLVDFTEKGQFDPAWVSCWVKNTRDAQRDPATLTLLVDLVTRLIKSPETLKKWGGYPLGQDALDCLRQWCRALPEKQTIANLWSNGLARFENTWLNPLVRSFDFAEELEICLRVADLPSIDIYDKLTYPLIEKIKTIRSHLIAEHRSILEQRLYEIALDDEWHCRKPDALLTADGSLVLSDLSEKNAGLLLQHDGILDKLNTASLLRVLAAAPRLDEGGVAKVCSAITAQWKNNSGISTQALISGEAWLFWRQAEDRNLKSGEKKKAALDWLHNPRWCIGKAAPDLCLEDWDQAIKDLQPGLIAVEMQSLFKNGNPRWPLAFCFEERQWRDLLQLARVDVATFRVLLSAAGEFAKTEKSRKIAEVDTAYRELFKQLESIDAMRLKPVEKERWETWLLLAGKVLIEYRAAAIIEGLSTNPQAALAAAEQPNILSHEKFVKQLIIWIATNLDVTTQQWVIGLVDAKFALIKLPSLAPSEVTRKLARKLQDKGYKHIAKFLDPTIDLNPIQLEKQSRPPNLPPATSARTGDRDQTWWNEAETSQHGVANSASPATTLGSNFPPEESNARFIIRLLELGEASVEAEALRKVQDGSLNLTCLQRSSADGEHPFCRLARLLLTKHSLETAEPRLKLEKLLWRQLEGSKEMLEHQPNPPCLPTFELWFSLGNMGLGGAAVRFIQAAAGQDPSLVGDVNWWQAVMKSLSRCRLRGDDRLDVAISHIISHANRNLKLPHRQALQKALEAANNDDRKLVKI